MKKVFLFTLLLSLFTPLFAQTDVTKFLGIPVDGSKIEMVRKLKAKGFVSSKDVWEFLKGEFNGRDVNIHVVTNNDKVWRIAVFDALPVSEEQIKTRFNILCQQFMSNSKYETLSAQPIPENEDISYEITCHKKNYEAAFLQKAETKDPALDLEKFNRQVWFRIQENYGRYFIAMYYDNKYNEAHGEDL